MKAALERLSNLLIDLDSDEQELVAVARVLTRYALKVETFALAVAAFELTQVFSWMVDSRGSSAQGAFAASRSDTRRRQRDHLARIWTSYHSDSAWDSRDRVLDIGLGSNLMALIDELRVVRRAAPLCEHYLTLVDLDCRLGVLEQKGTLAAANALETHRVQAQFQRALLSWLADPRLEHLQQMDAQLNRLSSLDVESAASSVLGRALLEQLGIRLPPSVESGVQGSKRFHDLAESSLHSFDAELRRMANGPASGPRRLSRRLIRRIVALVARGRPSPSRYPFSAAVAAAFLPSNPLGGQAIRKPRATTSSILQSEIRLAKREWARGQVAEERLAVLRDSMLILGQVSLWGEMVAERGPLGSPAATRLDELFGEMVPPQNRQAKAERGLKVRLEKSIRRHVADAATVRLYGDLDNPDADRRLLDPLDQLLLLIGAAVRDPCAASRPDRAETIALELGAESFADWARVTYWGKPLPRRALNRIQSVLEERGGLLQIQSQSPDRSGYWRHELRILLRRCVRSVKVLPVRADGLEFALIARDMRVRPAAATAHSGFDLATLLELGPGEFASQFDAPSIWPMARREAPLCIVCGSGASRRSVRVDSVGQPCDELLWPLHMPFVRSSYLAGVITRQHALAPVIDLSALLQLEAIYS